MFKFIGEGNLKKYLFSFLRLQFVKLFFLAKYMIDFVNVSWNYGYS